MKKTLLLLTLTLLSGCATVESVSLTSIPKDRSKMVVAQASKIIFLGLNFDNDFIDTLTTDLKTKCPKGVVSGILTKDESIDYFLLIVTKRKITATGYCTQTI